MSRRRQGAKSRPKVRRSSLRLGFSALVFLVLWSVTAEWFVHHPRQWVAERRQRWPQIATAPLLWFGNPLADLTDSLGLTGHDAVYEYDLEAPAGEVLFAGAPKRLGAPAPADIEILDRGEFKIGWSKSLRHPVWCAYHVTAQAVHDIGKRPNFNRDRSTPSSPHPDDYRNSGYDRGHMVPNYAITTRYGTEAQRRTFQMTNIAPQSPALNRGVWRQIEHRIADFWTARYGEIWVIVGTISATANRETFSASHIDVPTDFYQLVIAQEGMDIRALAMCFSQNSPWNDWAARQLVTIDELEAMTGLDFNPDLPNFIASPLESDLPSRLWPIRPQDTLRLIISWFN